MSAYCEGDRHSISLISDMTIGQLFDATCRKEGLLEALVFYGESIQLTFTQLHSQVTKLADGLLLMGLKIGQVVALWGANHANNVMCFYACVKIGLVPCILPPSCSAETLAGYLTLKCRIARLALCMRATVLICFPLVKVEDCYEILKNLDLSIEHATDKHCNSKRFPNLKHLIIDTDENTCSGTMRLSEMFVSKPKEKSHVEQSLKEVANLVQPHTLASIHLTADSTGDPKFVCLSHYQLINSCLVAVKRLNFDNSGVVLCCPMPIFRGPALCLALLAPLVSGIKVVFPGALPVAPIIFEAMQSQKCTCLLTNSIVLHLMLRMPVARKYTLESLTSVCVGGDHTTSEQVAFFFEKLPNLEDIMSGVFLTEAGFMPFMHPKGSKGTEIGASDGRIADHYKVRIMDFYENRPVEFNRPGKVCIKLIGDTKFLGYFGQHQLTEKYYKDSWLETGDVGCLSETGYVTLIGSVNDVIFRNGMPVIPSPIEKIVASHPSVLLCQVVGVPDEKLGEKVCACIIKKDEQTISESDLEGQVKRLFVDNKTVVPDIVLVFDDFPRTQAKKVHKPRLRALAASLIK